MNRSVKVIFFYTSIPSFFQRPRDTKLRALFIQDLYGPILQMLGTKYPYSSFLPSSAYQKLRYNIDPFFWSSTFNWIPSQFQDGVKPGIGDCESGLPLRAASLVFDLLVFIYVGITITLPFPRSMVSPDNYGAESADTWLGSQMIDTRAPFTLNSSMSLLYLYFSF
jgi:hypothetical protein